MAKTKRESESVSEQEYDSSSEEEYSDSEDYMPVEASNPELRENMDLLIEHLKETLLSNEKRKLRLSTKKNPILVQLNKYIRVLDKTTPEEHKDYFLKVYKRYRIPILANKDDRWLRKNQVKIVYENPKYGIRILLSAIYNIACELEKAANDRLDDEDMDLIRKDVILLHLYRVFREYAPEQDYDQLTTIIEDQEDLLGVESKGKVPMKSAKPFAGLGSLGDIANKLVQGIAQTADDNQLAKDELPDFGKMIQGIFQNEELKGTLNGLMAGFSDGGLKTADGGALSVDDVLHNVQNLLSNPQVSEATKTIMSTVKTSVVDKKESSGPVGKSTILSSIETAPNGPAGPSIRRDSTPALLDLPPISES